MALPESTITCYICDSLNHTLFPVLRGRYAGKHVCSICSTLIAKDPYKEIARLMWDKTLGDYIER